MNEENSLIRKLTRMGHHLKHIRFGKLEELGLYPGQPHLLFTLSHEDGISQRELANRINITPATMTRMLQRMEKNALLLRKPDENDQRITRVFITEKSQALLLRLKKMNDKMEEAILADFTEQDREKFSHYLDLIIERMHNYASSTTKEHGGPQS